MSTSDLLTEVLKLPRHERRELAEQVWESLEQNRPDGDSEQPIAPPFLDELKHRVEMVQSGRFESMAVEDSFALARMALAEATR